MGLFLVIHEGPSPLKGRPLLATDDPRIVRAVAAQIIALLQRGAETPPPAPVKPQRDGVHA